MKKLCPWLLSIVICLPTVTNAKALNVEEIAPTKWINKDSIITAEGDIISTDKYIKNGEVTFKAFITDEETHRQLTLTDSYDQTSASNLNPLVYKSVFALEDGGAMIFDHTDIGSNYIRFWYWDGSELSQEHSQYLEGCTSQNLMPTGNETDAVDSEYNYMVYEQNDFVYFFVNEDCDDELMLPFTIGAFNITTDSFNIQKFYFKRRPFKTHFESSPSLRVTETKNELVFNGTIETTHSIPHGSEYSHSLGITGRIDIDGAVTFNRHKKWAWCYGGISLSNNYDHIISTPAGYHQYICDSTLGVTYTPDNKLIYPFFQDNFDQIIMLGRNKNEYRDPASQYFIYKYADGALTEQLSFTTAESEPVYYDPEFFQTTIGDYLATWQKIDNDSGSRSTYSSMWDGSTWSASELIHEEDNGSAATTRQLEDGGILMMYDDSYNFFDGTVWSTTTPLFPKYSGATTYDQGANYTSLPRISQKNQKSNYLVIQNMQLETGKVISLMRIFNAKTGLFTKGLQVDRMNQWGVSNIITDPSGNTWYVSYSGQYDQEHLLEITL